jgi:photosystem II stability/assembly factor-like uncharacterized protein
MRVRLLLAAILAALIAGVVVVEPWSSSRTEGAAEQRAESSGECQGDEAAAEEAEREREAAAREGEGFVKDAAEIAREKAYGGCSESENEILAITSPNEVMLARQLIGADKGIDPGAYFRAARADAAEAEVAGGAWTLDRPTSKGGRVLDVVVDPTQPDTIYTAAATGGVWKSTNRGSTFTSVWPDDATQSIGALAIAPDGTLYAGTGEAGPGGGSSTYGGDGVYRSRDGGATWEHIGLTDTNRVGRVVVDPRNPQRIFVAGTGPLYNTSGPGRGLFLSEDGGDSWNKVLAGENATAGAADVAIDPRDSKIVYATMWDNFRERDRRAYEGVGSGLYKSIDGGKTWARIGTPFFGPRPDLGRIGVAVASDGTVYANASGVSGTYNGFYASKDGGLTWTTGAPPAVPLDSFYVYGWWFGRIYVDPANPKHVYQAGVRLQESKDGGQTFANAPGEYHSDQHGMAWDPKVANRVYLGNDDGVYRSDDNGLKWNRFKYLPIGQINTFDISQQDPNRMVVGLQDNGSNLSWNGSGSGNERWFDYTGGDGQRVNIAPDRQKVVYGCYQYGECVVSVNADKGPGTQHSFTNDVVSSRKNWITPIEFDPKNSKTVYTGGEIMSRSLDDGQTWTVISPELSNGPGRETNPLFKNYGTLTTIAPAGEATKTIYAGTDDGNLWYTHDLSSITAWKKATDPDLPKAWITRVEVDPRDKSGNTAYVSYSGFRQNDNAAYVLKTTDGGLNWSDISRNLPKAPVNDVKVVKDAVVVGTDVGVFFRRSGDAEWLRLGTGLPMAPAYELQYQAATDMLYAGTFGRSAWKTSAAVLG